MRSLPRSVLLLIGLSVLAGCWRRTRADFPRPPAAAATPAGEDRPEPEAPEETRRAEEPVLEVEPEPPVEEPEPRPDEGPKSAPPAPPPPEPPNQAPEPPSRERVGNEGLDPELLTKLERASFPTASDSNSRRPAASSLRRNGLSMKVMSGALSS